MLLIFGVRCREIYVVEYKNDWFEQNQYEIEPLQSRRVISCSPDFQTSFVGCRSQRRSNSACLQGQGVVGIRQDTLRRL
jgi:hypothetical protein